MLHLDLLGDLRLRHDDKLLPGLGRGKGALLLAYLATERDRRHGREELAGLLWPELERAAARHNLRQRISELRRLPGEVAILDLDRTSVALRVGALRLDIDGFTAHSGCKPGPSACGRCIDDAEARLALYRGPFLAGVEIPSECDELYDWVQVRREHLQRHALALLEHQCRCCEGRGDLDAALRHSQRLVELAPWDEAARRTRMRLLARSGVPQAAQREYAELAALLDRELQAAPEAETRALNDRIAGGLPLPPPESPAAPPALPAAPPERRRLVALYAALSQPGAEDPEELEERLEASLAAIRDALEAAGAHVLPWHLGGMFGFFGFPRAIEGAARRAAALATRRLTALAAELGPTGLELRVGLHVGALWCGVGDQPHDPAGATSQVAVNLALLAGSGEVLASGAVWRLVEGFHHGVARPASGALTPWLLGPPTGAADRIEAAPALSPFVGRQAELARLRAAWKAAASGRGGAVLLQGEPGIGKSRLLRELRTWLGHGTPQFLLRGHSEDRDSPFRSLAVLVEGLAGITAGHDATERLRRITAALNRIGRPEALPACAELLGLALPGSPLAGLGASERKRRVIEALVGLLPGLGGGAPLLLGVEDLHWIDPSTQAVLERLVSGLAAAPLLIVLTTRPEADLAWLPNDLPRIFLRHLTAAEGETLALAQGLRGEAVRRVIAAADGVPLFVEEIAALTAAGGVGEAIPERLDELLAARLDRLGGDKPLAQLAALFGRDFEHGPLLAVAGLAAPELDDALGRLQAAGLVQTTGAGSYRFKHALLQQAAYHSQLRRHRREGHRRIAELLESRYPDEVARRPEYLAAHLGGAGRTEEAVRLWLRAGSLAEQRWANGEAIAHLRQGLALCATLPEGSGRDTLELELLTTLGRPLIQAQGFGSAEASECYRRALALVDRLGREELRFSALWGWWLGSGCRSGHPSSRDLALEILALAQEAPDPWLRIAGLSALGNSLFWMGEFAAARAPLEEAVARAAALQRRPWHDSGEDPAITARCFLSWTLFCQGEADAALAEGRLALAEASGIDHPNSLGYALAFLALTHRLRGEPRDALEWAERSLAHGLAYGFQTWTVCGRATAAWARIQLGTGLGEQGRDDLAILTETSALVHEIQPSVVSVFIGMEIEALMRLGRYAEVPARVERGLSLAAAKGDRWYTDQYHRLRTESLRRMSPPADGDAR